MKKTAKKTARKIVPLRGNMQVANLALRDRIYQARLAALRSAR